MTKVVVHELFEQNLYVYQSRLKLFETIVTKVAC